MKVLRDTSPRFVSVILSTPHPCSSSELMSDVFRDLFRDGFLMSDFFFLPWENFAVGNLGNLGEVFWVGPKNPSTLVFYRASWIRVILAMFFAAKART